MGIPFIASGRRTAPTFAAEAALPGTTRGLGSRTKPPGLLLQFLIGLALTFSLSGPVVAGTSGGVCLVDRYNTVNGTSLSDLNCTTNSVAVAHFTRVEGPSACLSGQTIQVKLSGTFRSTASERFDVGVFIAEGDNDPNATGGTCYSDFLYPVSADNTDLDLGSGVGPFYNAEISADPADMCGDITDNEDAVFITDWISVPCQDSDGDTVADVASCTVWAANASDGTANKPSCADEGDVSAENNAQCTCETVNIAGIDFVVEASIEVQKSLPFPGDAGVFNLQIDGVTGAADVGHNGTTGAVTVGAGTNLDPGATHTVGETAGTGTSLDSYTTSISCVDRGLTTFGDLGQPLVQNDAGPLDVPVLPDDDIVCTITNTNGCATASCDSFDTFCADFVCDPTAAIGSQCVVQTYNVGAVCNPGSGDVCDPPELCVDGLTTCPDDTFDDGSTVCRLGSGDMCDPDETCTGVADEACPADVITPIDTVCDEGSGDMCDPDEVCSGVAGEVCPSGDTNLAAKDTVCNPGSGDTCDPDEVCSGIEGDACPDDTFDDGSSVCNAGSGDLCDPDEMCPGVADAACPDDTIADAGTVCREGSDDVCDADEVCTGAADAACPADDAPGNAGLVCRPGLGDFCDQDEQCSGTPGATCPDDDSLNNGGVVCRPSGTGFVDCDPAEVCPGTGPGSECPDDYIEPEGTACGDPSTTECTDPDTCDDAGVCLNNNKVCGSVTNSSLCEYDMEPTKGTCQGGTEDGTACLLTSSCAQGGGYCDIDECIGGVENGLYCEPDPVDACLDGGGLCIQSDQFRLLFSPDAQNWTAYRLNASNPGQTYYNVMYDASGAGLNDVVLTITVPYPYVTVGGMPLHVYDGEAVAGNGLGCLEPTGAIRAEPMFITLDDWIYGADGNGAYGLDCAPVIDPGGSGSCTFDVVILNEEIPAGGLLYVNLHLDYGLKGQWVDANPVGPDGAGIFEDRYDRAPDTSPWGSSDALVNSLSDDGELAIADCQAYWFEHTDDGGMGYCDGGADDGQACALEGDPCADGAICVPGALFRDSVENLNLFGKISGLFGRVYCADDDSGFAYALRLVHPSNGVVDEVTANADGSFAFAYEHKGKPTDYTVELYPDDSYSEFELLATATVRLKGNGWWDVSFFATDCGDEPTWDSEVTYGKPPRTK